MTGINTHYNHTSNFTVISSQETPETDETTTDVVKRSLDNSGEGNPQPLSAERVTQLKNTPSILDKNTFLRAPFRQSKKEATEQAPQKLEPKETVEVVDAKTLSQLEIAVRSSCLSTIKTIFTKMSSQQRQIALCFVNPNHHLSLIALAAYFGHEAMIDFFIESFENKKRLCEELRKELQFGTPLCIAVEKGHLGVIKKLLNCFESKDERLSYQRQRVSLYAPNSLDLAVSYDYSHIVDYFISEIPENERYTELCQKDARGCTPLLIAAARGNSNTIHVLMKSLSAKERADYLLVSAPDGFTPLFCAVQVERTESIHALLHYCSEHLTITTYVKRTDSQGMTVLHTAAEEGKLKALSALLTHLSKDRESFIECWHAKTRWGNTPLHIAIQNGHHQCIAYLLDNIDDTLDAGVCNLFDETPLHYASKEGNQDVVAWYAGHAPHLFKQKSFFDYTPLELCLMHRKESLLQLLRKSGIDNLSAEKDSIFYGTSLIPISQGHIIKKIIAYLKRKNRLSEELLSYGQRDQLPPVFSWNSKKKQWRIEGLCFGLAFLKSYYSSMKKIDHFYEAIESISSWDESAESLISPLDPKIGYSSLGDLMEQWVNDLFWFQHDKSFFIKAFGQHDVKGRFDLVSPSANKKLQEEGDLQFKLNREQLAEVIQLLKHRSECEFLVTSLDEETRKSHVISMTPCKENGWEYYDSSYKHRLKKSISDDHLIDFLIASLIPFPRPTQMDVRIKILTFYDAPSNISTIQGCTPKEILYTPSPCGFTPLHKAQFSASTAHTLELLNDPLNRYEQVLAVDKFGNTPLHLAVQLGSKEKVDALLSGLDPKTQQQCLNQQNQAGYTPLALSVVAKGDITLTEYLLQVGEKEDRFLLKSVKFDNGTSLQHFLWKHNPLLAISLYETLTKDMTHSELFTWIRQTNDFGYTMFHYALFFDHVFPLLERIFEDLSPEERCTCLNDTAPEIGSPLDWAKKQDDPEYREKLLQLI